MMLKQKKKGITLIALIITIIVLLILVGITMVVILGPEGILKKAHDSRVAGRVVTIRDRITVWQAENKTKRQIGEAPITLEQFLGKLVDEGLMTDVEVSGMVNDTLQIGDEVIYFYNPILSEINIGDTIIYDPTIGAQASQLTYTSRVGSAEAGKNVSGNGYSVQTFTAKNTDNEWLVLDKENGQLKLMSKAIKIPDNAPTDTFNNTGYILTDGRGWLYAEQELHRACAIYGHGKGIDKTKVITYKVGNDEIVNEEQTKTLKGSGARSIIIDDLQQMTTAKLTISKDEATKVNLIGPVFLPSLSGRNILGQCKDLHKKQNLPYTHKATLNVTYNTNKINKYSNLEITDIFKDKYWVASRNILINSTKNVADFCVFVVTSSHISANSPVYGYQNSYGLNAFARGIRPIVYLEPEVELEETVNQGVWQLKQ